MSYGALLAGGPYHGKQMAIPPETTTFVTVVSPPVSAMFSRLDPPRPSWWKLRELRAWKHREKLPDYAVPEFRQLLYRERGKLADGTRLFWYGGEAIEPPSNTNELMHHLYRAMADADFHVRVNGHWEMGRDWYNAIRRATAFRGAPEPGDMILAREVVVTGDTGAPRIVEYTQESSR